MSVIKIDFVFLLKAIKENQNIFLYKKGKNNSVNLRYFSRFFLLKPQTRISDKEIIVDFPYADGYTNKRLKKGNLVSIVFHEAGFRFSFDTIVSDSIELEIKKGISIPALILKWPTEILDGNRRSMFRAAVNLDSFPRVSYFILERSAKGKLQKNFSEFEGIETLMIDISEIGAAVKINREINIQVGDRIKLIFLLEEDNQKETELEGIVRNIRRFPHSETHVCGIEFDPDLSSYYKQVLRDIAYYAMSLDRDNVSFFAINQIVSNNPYVQKIVDHEVTDDVINMLINKELPLTDFEFLESMVYVLDFIKYRPTVEKKIGDIPVSVKEDYVVCMDANYKVVDYLLKEALNNNEIKVIAGVIKNPYLPVEFLINIALKGTPKVLRLLLANKIRLITYPKILDVIEENPKMNLSIQSKVLDLKNIYLKTREVSEISKEDVVDQISGISKAELVFYEEKPEIKKNNFEKKQNITEQALGILKRINQMSFSERIKLAHTGTKVERLILTNDTNEMIHMALIESPKISEDEILKIIENKNTSHDIIYRLCENKKWTKNYSVRLALLKNRNVSMIKAPNFILKLNLSDLKKLVMDKTIHPMVHNLVSYFYNKKK